MKTAISQEEPAGTHKDKDLIQLIEECVDQFGDSLFRYALVKTKDESASEELVQETFLAAVSAGKSFRNESTISTWLFAILKNKIADHFRKIRRQRSSSELEMNDPKDHSSTTTPFGRNHGWNENPATLYENEEFWETFQACVEKLPNKLAEVYILREINQQSPKEIRELLGIGATNLSMRLSRCRLALRECLSLNWFAESTSRSM